MSRDRSEEETAALLAALHAPGPTRERLVRALAVVVQERRRQARLQQRRRSLDR